MTTDFATEYLLGESSLEEGAENGSFKAFSGDLNNIEKLSRVGRLSLSFGLTKFHEARSCL